METLEFLPMLLRKAAYDRRGGARYRVLGPGGERMDIEADSAAEALSKSGISHPVRIVNLGLEPDLNEATPLLMEDASVATDISLDEVQPVFVSADMLSSESPADVFTEFSLGELVSRMKMLQGGREPNPLIAQDEKLEPPTEAARSDDPAATLPAGDIPEAPVSGNAAKPATTRPKKRELSEDEIARLLTQEQD